MTCLNKCAAVALAVSLCFAVGCSNNNSNNSSGKDASSASEAAQNTADSQSDNSESSAAADNSEEVSSEEIALQYSVGENLANTLVLFAGSYTYTAEVGYSDGSGTSEVIQVSDGENFYQRSTESDSDTLDGDSAYLYTDSQGYDIDFNLNAYDVCEQKSTLNVFELVKECELEQTDTHIPADTQGMTVEEYTYAGDTYMTVLDFYFGEDGALEKYTATYSVEGDDDIIETVTVKSIEQTADDSYFDVSVLENMTDFGEISEDTRLGFCQGVCATYGISTDNMYEMDITTDDLKRIDFDTFRELVYTYANLE